MSDEQPVIQDENVSEFTAHAPNRPAETSQEDERQVETKQQEPQLRASDQTPLTPKYEAETEETSTRVDNGPCPRTAETRVGDQQPVLRRSQRDKKAPKRLDL